MPPTVDQHEEQGLLDAVKQAGDLVTKGMTPDDAVEKVARASGFGPGSIRLLGHAYNNGTQLNQWRQPSTSILDKLASFPLCDPEVVIDRIYNGPTPAEKTAALRVSADYSRAPHWFSRTEGSEKRAAVALPRNPPEPYKPDPLAAVHKAYAEIQRTKQASDECRRQAGAAEDAVRRHVTRLATYLKQANYNRLPFEVIESASATYFGDAAKPLLDMAYASSKIREKRAGDAPPLLKTPVNLNAEPFSIIKAAMDAGAECVRLRKQAAELKQKADTTKVEAIRPFSKAGEAQQPAETGPWSKEAAAIFGTEKAAFGLPLEVGAIAAGDIIAHNATQPRNPDPYGDVGSLQDELATVRRQAQMALSRPKKREKQAFLGMGLSAALGGAMGRQLGPLSKAKSDLVDDDWMKLEDPEHENELRKIKAHAMINSLMTDPDDPISAHDPDRVLSAYNEIAQASPRVADNVAILRPQLRKRLEGHQEPFETKEMLDIEKGLAQTKMPTPNTSILSESPDKILG